MDKKEAKKRLAKLFKEYEFLINQPNKIVKKNYNGIYYKYKYPILTADHTPVYWRFDLNPKKNPFLMERLGISRTSNPSAALLNDKYFLVVQVEGYDGKSFFSVAESPNGFEKWRFWDYPVTIPVNNISETNVSDIRLTQHEDGWIYGLFSAERIDKEKDSNVDLISGIVRTKDLKNWERLSDIETSIPQNKFVLHPEFIEGKYAFYSQSKEKQEIIWSFVDSIENTKIIEGEEMVNENNSYSTNVLIKEQGTAPIKTKKGWLHLIYATVKDVSGVKNVIYIYLTALESPTKVIAKPSGYFMMPGYEEQIEHELKGLFVGGWIKNNNDEVFIYYTISGNNVYVATSTIEQLLDYVLNTPEGASTSSESIQKRNELISKNLELIRKKIIN